MILIADSVTALMTLFMLSVFIGRFIHVGLATGIGMALIIVSNITFLISDQTMTMTSGCSIASDIGIGLICVGIWGNHAARKG